MSRQIGSKSRWWMDGVWQARQERRPKEILNPESNVMQRGCVDCDLEQAWASWQASEDVAFTRPFSDASGRGAMLLERWECRTEAWGLGKETHVHGTANTLAVSVTILWRNQGRGRLKTLRWLMADSAQDRITEQGASCLAPFLSPALVIALVFFIDCLTQSPCYPGTDYRAQTGLELVTIFLLPIPDYRSKMPGWAPTPPLVNNTHPPPNNQHHPYLGLQKPEVIKMLIIEREKKEIGNMMYI